MVVAGERRRQASIIAGLGEVDVLVVGGAAVEISPIENVQRRCFNPIDEAEATERLRQIEGYTHEELAWLTGRTPSSVTDLLSLARLPSSIKTACRQRDVPESLLVDVAKQPSAADMEALLARSTSGRWRRMGARTTAAVGAPRQSAPEPPAPGTRDARAAAPPPPRVRRWMAVAARAQARCLLGGRNHLAAVPPQSRQE